MKLQGTRELDVQRVLKLYQKATIKSHRIPFTNSKNPFNLFVATDSLQKLAQNID